MSTLSVFSFFRFFSFLFRILDTETIKWDKTVFDISPLDSSSEAIQKHLHNQYTVHLDQAGYLGCYQHFQSFQS